MCYYQGFFYFIDKCFASLFAGNEYDELMLFSLTLNMKYPYIIMKIEGKS